MNGYGWCDTCRQPPGLRCINLARKPIFGRRWYPFYCKRPHRGRRRLT